jgi:O-antigen/teichoic acid export membrane protein
MVLFFLGAEASGVYALMMTLANGLQTIRNGFNPIITPVVSGMDESRLKTDLKPVYSYCVSMATMIQVIIGFFIVLFPEEIMSIAGKSYVVQPMALGILLFFQLVVTFFGMVNTVIDGIGKSVVNLKASVIQLLTSVVAGFILIPQFGLLGAALSMLIYGIVSSVYCNVYLLKRSLQPYSSKLWIDIVWMVLLLALYILINAQVVTLTMVGKIAVYVCVLLLLGAQFLFYKRKF